MESDYTTGPEYDLQKELAAFIIHQSWECTNGVLSEALIFDAIQMARKYHGIRLHREYEYQKPSE